MSNYRRAWVPGGTYFFTINLLERRRRLLLERIELLGDAFRTAQAAWPFTQLASKGERRELSTFDSPFRPL